MSIVYKSEGFIKREQELIKNTVIPYQYDILNDGQDGVEKSHAIKNFENAAKSLKGDNNHDGFKGMVFQDSDVAKWLEAAAYSLEYCEDKELEALADKVIDTVSHAQEADGYLNTYYTIKGREKSWTNLLEGHELYCSGHMLEAAVAYYEATGKTALLDVAKKNADLIYKLFIEDKKEGVSGHPEIELALIRLYKATGNKKYLDLAGHFINARGVNPKFFLEESKKRNWQVWGMNPHDTDYNQSSLPVREQKDAVGHSVRAVYLYTAMAGYAAITDDKELLDACKRLFESIVNKRMYITGGIGSSVHGEAFTADYDLPNDTAYAETCASIGLIFFMRAMLENEIDSKYADIAETAFYNNVLAGMSLDGKRFFYVNPLEVIPDVSGKIATHTHALPERPQWFSCACCPPNTARLIMSVQKYAYSEKDGTAFCHMFAAGNVKFQNGTHIKCETEYPFNLIVEYKIIKASGALAVRIPSWSKKTSIAKNGVEIKPRTENGYAYFENLCENDVLKFSFDDTVKHIYSNPAVFENSGMTALKRGPLVYCAEGVDNGNDVLSLVISENGTASVEPFEIEGLRINKIVADGYKLYKATDLYTEKKIEKTPYKITAVPYFVWGNRGKNQMRVWLPEV